MAKSGDGFKSLFTDCPVDAPDPNGGSGDFGKFADADYPAPTNGGQIQPVQTKDVDGGDRGAKDFGKSRVQGAGKY